MNSLPHFSVVIPTYNRPHALRSCLQALMQLRYPRQRFEVIAVDDGSTQPVHHVVEPFRQQMDITLLRQENRGPAAARNTGALRASGSLLAFTDDDCAPAPEWLFHLAQPLLQEPDALVGGRTLNGLTGNPFSSASQSIVSFLYARQEHVSGSGRFFASNNIALSATQYRRLGGFDPSYPDAAGEDRAFCDRWAASGHPMIYAPRATLYHYHDLNLKSFWQQNVNYGRGAHRVRRGRALVARRPLRLEKMRFYRDLLAHPFTEQAGPLHAVQQCLLIAVAQVAIGVGFLREARAAHRSGQSAGPPDG